MSPVNAQFAYITITYYYLMNMSAISGPSSGSKQIQEMHKTFVRIVIRECRRSICKTQQQVKYLQYGH
jgi:hypothetical protein